MLLLIRREPVRITMNWWGKSMLRITRISTLAVSLGMMTVLAGAGCVTKGTFEKSQASLSDAESRIGDLESQLAAASSRGAALEGTVAENQRALAELRAREAQKAERIAAFRELTEKFSALVDAGKLSVKVVNGRMVVQMQTDVLFSSGSAKLSDDGIAAVEEVSGLLSSLSGRRYQIEGHTDNVPIKTRVFPSNWELAAGRAITVVQLMVEKGMQADRVSAVSYGDTMPIASNDTPEGRALNRRIEIVVVPDLSQLPGFEELQSISEAGDGGM